MSKPDTQPMPRAVAQRGEEGPAAVTRMEELRTWQRLSEPGRASLAAVTETASAWRALWLARHEVDAIWALAATLPRRRAVWWATLAAWHGVSGQPSPVEHQTFAAVMDWLREPDAPRAARVGQCVPAVGLNTPIGSAARAVSVPVGLEAAEAVATAVFLSQHRASQHKKVAYEAYLTLGRSVAVGSLNWHLEGGSA